MNLFDQINEDLKTAMKNREEGRLRALRGIKSALLLLRTEKGGTAEISPDAEIKTLQKLVKQRKESYDIYVQQNRSDLADVEKEEIDVIEKYLPQQMGEAELRSALQEIASRVGASGPKDMGKVMGAASKELAGKADGKMIAALVKEILGN